VAYSTLQYDIEDRILTLTLNRPEVLNAFSVTMAEELVQAFNAASEDDEVRAIVVTGAGRAFCAGMDLQPGDNVFGLDESQRPDLDGAGVVRDTGGVVTLAMYNCKKPIIGAINGVGVGIGATMTLAMDIRLASDKARFGFVFSKLGVGRRSGRDPRVQAALYYLSMIGRLESQDASEANSATSEPFMPSRMSQLPVPALT